MIRVLVVDDHAVVRRGVVQIVTEAEGVQCVGEAGSSREALQLARACEYDVVVLDIHLPDGSGLDVLKQLRAFKPQTPVVMLSMYPEEQYALRALRAGAMGYLTKDSAPIELVTALRQAARGEHYVTPALAETLTAHLDDVAAAAPLETLSDREEQVLRLLAAGHTVSHIAEELTLSVKTVSTYRARLLKKLGLTSTAELIRYAVEHDLID
ncbi:MAG TPA: response regulator transcription factor [Anaerolineae bacterium]|nr:response regulator transcription factor [Anaerolineae bacterium]